MSDRKKEINVTIGQHISEARRKRDVTQEALAYEIGVSSQYLSNLERGIVGVSVETLIKLCRALEVSSDYILMGNKEIPDETTTAAIDLNRLSSKQLADISHSLNILLSSGTK